MESIKSGWQELKTISGPKCPKLFYNFTADDNGYALQFTDLIGFWTANSPTRDINDYAKITKASIDPSDSQSQLRVLQEKLCQSLADGENNLRQDDEEASTILLQTVLKLPRPLQPLKWEFALDAQGTEELAEKILRPCLLEASESKNKLESLEGVIKAKDHVIAKLMDKIEGSTIDLSIIFPGITGARSRKGQTTLKDAQKHVPGLKPFSKDDWQKHFEVDSPYAGFEMDGLSKLVIGIEKCPKHKSHQHEQWLSKLPRATSSASQAARAQIQASSDEDDTESDSDEFETQKKKKASVTKSSDQVTDFIAEPRPKRAKTSSPIRSSSPILPPPPLSISQTQKPARSSSTTLPSEPSDLENPHPRTRSRLGKLGSKPKTPVKAQSRSDLPTSSPPPAPRIASPSPDLPSSPPALSTIAPIESRPKSSSSIATLSSLNPTTPPKRKLGRLGSYRSNSASVSITPEHKRVQDQKVSSKETSQPSSTQASPTRRLGRIGRTASQLSRQQTRSSPIPEYDQSKGLKDIDEENDKANESDASTASTASSVSPNPARVDIKEDTTQAGDGSWIPDSGVASSVPQLETQELSKEEKAAQRRQELKRTIGAVDGGTVGPVGNTGLRKKRKF